MTKDRPNAGPCPECGKIVALPLLAGHLAAPVGPPTPPPSIRVGTVTYTVSFDRQSWAEFQVDARQHGQVGATDNQAARIYLDPGLAPDVLRISLWHEVLHALHASVMGGPTWLDLGADQDAREETVVGSWEHPTLAVLRDNPSLVRYLMGDA